MQENKLKGSPVGERAQKIVFSLFDEGDFLRTDAYCDTGVVTGCGNVEGAPVLFFCQDGTHLGGAVSTRQVEQIAALYALAAKMGAPVVGIYDSKGGCLTEGTAILKAYSKLIEAANAVSGVVPQISYIAGACGGSAAVAASLADFVLMHKDAALFLSDSSDSSDADACEKTGAAHLVFETDEEAAEAIRRLLTYLPQNNLSFIPFAADGEMVAGEGDLITSLVDEESFFEIASSFGKEIRTGFAQIAGNSVAILEAADDISAEASAKAARFVGIADAFSVPLVAVVNSSGFAKSAAQSALRDASKLSYALAQATNPKIAVFSNKAYGSAYTAFAGCDCRLALTGTEISPVQPDAAVTVLYSERLDAGESRDSLRAEYTENYSGALAAAAAGAVEDIIEPQQLRSAVAARLTALSSKRVLTIAKKHGNLPF